MLNEGPETAGCLSVGRVGLWASTVRPSVAAPDWNQEDVRRGAGCAGFARTVTHKKLRRLWRQERPVRPAPARRKVRRVPEPYVGHSTSSLTRPLTGVG